MKFASKNHLRYVFLVITILMVTACADDNKHFCAKYSYYNDQLSEPGIMPLSDIKQQLLKDIEKHDRRKDRLMLIVLEDKMKGLLSNETDAVAWCEQMQRWKLIE